MYVGLRVVCFCLSGEQLIIHYVTLLPQFLNLKSIYYTFTGYYYAISFCTDLEDQTTIYFFSCTSIIISLICSLKLLKINRIHGCIQGRGRTGASL